MTEYLIPDTIEEALHLLAAHAGQARIIAGGTDVLPDIRKGKLAPACLVDVTRIPELAQITIENEAEHPERRAASVRGPESKGAERSLDKTASPSTALRTGFDCGLRPSAQDAFVTNFERTQINVYVIVGAAVTFATLREHPYLQAHVHALVEAAASVGAAPIQAAATWAGNLVQAMPAADGAISAVALGAELHVMETAGERWLPILSTFLGPGRSAIDPTRQIITAIRFPIPATQWGTAWRRASRRPSLILPTLNCAAKLVLDGRGERITDAAIALGPVAACPHRAAEAEAYLIGRAPEPGDFAEAARLAQLSADPRSSVHRASREYRLAILPVLVEEALEVAAERAYRKDVIT